MKTLLKNLAQSIPSPFIILLLLVLPFIYSTRVPDPSLTPRLLALNILVLAVVLGFAFRRDEKAFLKLTGSVSHPLFGAYAGYLFFGGLSVFFAVNAREGIYDWTRMMLFFILLILLVYALKSKRNNRESVVKTIVVLALLLCIRGFYEVFSVSSTGAFDHQASYFIRAYSSNRNLFSQFLFLCFPFTAYGVTALKQAWRVASAIAALLILVLSVILLTRSVWVAFALAFIVTFVLFLIFSFKTTKFSNPVKKLLFYLVLFFGIVGISLLIYAQFGDLKVFREQLYWIGNYKFGSSLERVGLWQKSLQMSRDNPLTGVGAGNWKICFPAYGMMTGRPDAATTFFQRPHNDFIWVLAENGIFACLFYVLIFFLAFRSMVRALENAQNTNDLLFYLLLVFGLTGYLVFALLSFPRERIEHQVFLHLYLALVVVSAPRKPTKETKLSKFTRLTSLGFVVVLLLFATLLTAYRISAEIHTLEAYRHRDQQKHQQTIIDIDRAENLFTTLDTYSTPLTWYRGEAHFMLGHLEEAFRDFRKANQQHPNHIYVLNNLATSYELKGDHARAKDLYARALDIFPEFEDALLNLTAVYYNENELDSAIIMLSKISLSSDNPRYTEYRTTVLHRKLIYMVDSSDEQLISGSVGRIKNDEQWTLKVFEQAVGSQNDFESEVYNEAIYLLESVDSTITHEEAIKLRNRFNLESYE